MGELPLVFPPGPGGGPFGRRLRRPAGGRTPVIVVTGFLGAGKTTLVKALLASEAGRGTAVVVNEFGEIGLDQALLAPAAEAKVALLGNGCLCCALRSDLETTFRHLHTDRARGAIPAFERVVLETSGADDPTPILQTFLSERALAREYHLQAVVTVIDAATATQVLDASPEAVRQLAVADRIVLTKTDLAPPELVDLLVARLATLAPGVPVETAWHGEVPAAFLFADSALPLPSAFAAEPVGGVHTAGLSTFVIGFEAPVPWRRLSAALGLMQDLRGADLLRVKGLVAVEGCRGPVLVQGVRHVLHRPIELEDWPDGRAVSRLVFIVRGGIARAPVEALFRAVLAL